MKSLIDIYSMHDLLRFSLKYTDVWTEINVSGDNILITLLMNYNTVN